MKSRSESVNPANGILDASEGTRNWKICSDISGHRRSEAKVHMTLCL